MRMKQLSMAATYRDDMVVRMPKVLAIPSRYRAEELVLVFQCLNVYDLNNYLVPITMTSSFSSSAHTNHRRVVHPISNFFLASIVINHWYVSLLEVGRGLR